MHVFSPELELNIKYTYYKYHKLPAHEQSSRCLYLFTNKRRLYLAAEFSSEGPVCDRPILSVRSSSRDVYDYAFQFVLAFNHEPHFMHYASYKI